MQKVAGDSLLVNAPRPLRSRLLLIYTFMRAADLTHS